MHLNSNLNMSQKKLLKKICFNVFLPAFIFSILVIPNSVKALTVSPARIEVSGDPGTIVPLETQLFNEQNTASTFYYSFANFEAQGESGTPNFVSSGSGLETWFNTPESITLKSGEQKKVPVTIKIPENAQPGGYFAGIFLSTNSPKTEKAGDVSIGAKVGILVLLRVNGDIKEQGGVSDFQTRDKSKFYTALPISFSYRFQNSGSDRIRPTGKLTLRNILGLKSADLNANPADGNVLPFGSVRKFEVTWGKKENLETKESGFFNNVSYEWHNFAFGPYFTKLKLTYGSHNTIAESNMIIFVFPWHLILLILISLIILYILIHLAFKKYNHWVILQAEHLLEEKEEHEHTEHTHSNSNLNENKNSHHKI